MDFSDPETSPNFFVDTRNKLSLQLGFMESQLIVHD